MVAIVVTDVAIAACFSDRCRRAAQKAAPSGYDACSTYDACGTVEERPGPRDSANRDGL
jgi:hypothetical protein